jgi:hypothetical protein
VEQLKMKYANKSSATRAAKKQFGGEWETQAAVMLATDSDGWEIIPRQPEPEAVEPKQHLTLAEALAESGETLAGLIDEAPAVESKAADKVANKQALGWRFSTCEKPTKKVWAIAESMPGARRKDVIAACEAAGIGAGTSRTQYQAWFAATKASGINPRG